MRPLARDGIMAPRNPSLPGADEGSASLPHQQTIEAILNSLRAPLLALLKQEEARFVDRKLASLAELAAGAAHEINTPLAVIVGEAQHLLKNEAVPERRHSLVKIVAKAKQIHQLLRDLLFVAKARKRRLSPVALNALAAKAWTEVESLASMRKVRLKRRSPVQPLTIQGDRTLLQEAMTELLRNAVQAAPVGGWVTYRITSDSAWAVFAVLDSGRGFTEEQREHLFDPFYSGRSAGRGKGLGLAKVWRIAQLHDGSVQAFSEPGLPTRFELRLPLERSRRSRGSSAARNGQASLSPHLPVPRRR